jgi:hypothetical protein
MVKNDDIHPHNVCVQALFYDVNKNLILKQDSYYKLISPNESDKLEITHYNDLSKIKSYELEIKEWM